MKKKKFEKRFSSKLILNTKESKNLTGGGGSLQILADPGTMGGGSSCCTCTCNDGNSWGNGPIAPKNPYLLPK